MKSLDALQTDRATFSVGQAISDGWNLVSKHMGYYILGGVVAVLIGMAAGLIPIAGGIANGLIISPCFAASAIYISWNISKGIAWTDFGDIFKGFKYLGPMFVSSLIQSVAMGALIVLCFFNYIPQLKDFFELSQSTDAYNNREAIEALARQFFNMETLGLFLLLMLALMLLSIVWAFKNHFIVIYNLQAWQAMEMSRKITTHNLLPLIGLFFLLGIIIIISALPCGIGLLFSLPLSITAVYSAFAQITECDSTEIDSEMFDFVTPGNE
jgi:ABC-type multidrug transport system fused ATPase/permease subunit